jgi:glycosyltransferase involved in cell wall biosynthesis
MRDHLAYSVLMPLAPWEPPEQVAVALESLENQTLSPAQVVVSCDGVPPDDLKDVLSCTSMPVEIVLGPGGEGVGPVLARGLECCTEEFVIRADADDLSVPERCEIQVTLLSERPELAALSSKILEFDNDPTRPRQIRDVPYGRDRLFGFSRWRNPINHPAVAFRRMEIVQNGSYRNCPGFEDYDLWLRLLKNGLHLDNIPYPLVLVRVGIDHVKRRQGISYARKEIGFLRQCLRENLISMPTILILILTRIPMRLLPRQVFSYFLRKLFRSRHFA